MPSHTIKNLGEFRQGDTFKGLPVTVNINGSPQDLTGAVIICKFRDKSQTGNVKKTVSTTSGGITITDAVNGQYQIDAFDLDLPPGEYHYSIQQDVGNVKRTYISGTIIIKTNAAN